MVYSAIQETVSDRLRMAKTQLVGKGRGIELWRLLVRDYDAPEQPIAQWECNKRWMYPQRCRDAKELAERLPQWEVWGRDLETARGSPLEEQVKVCALDQLLPEEYRKALEDRYELETYTERLRWVKRRLESSKHRAMAQATATAGPSTAITDIHSLVDAALASSAADGDASVSASGEETAVAPLEEFIGALRRAFGKGGKAPRKGDKGGGKGQPKGAAFAGDCFNCGKAGHRAIDCPDLPEAERKRRREAAERAKGKGKGKGGMPIRAMEEALSLIHI